MPAEPFETHYMFSVKAELAAYPIGETPAGFRIDVEYLHGEVKTNSKRYFDSWDYLLPANALALDDERKHEWLVTQRHEKSQPDRDAKAPGVDWFGLEGAVVSGSDWLLVRRDGVIEIDGRMTLQEKTGDGQGGALINAQLSTVLDLARPDPRPAPPRPKGSDVYETWKLSKGKLYFDFPMAIRFVAADASQPWAAEEYSSLGGYWRLSTLPLGHYAANARAEFEDGLLRRIEFDVYRIRFAKQRDAETWL